MQAAEGGGEGRGAEKGTNAKNTNNGTKSIN